MSAVERTAAHGGQLGKLEPGLWPAGGGNQPPRRLSTQCHSFFLVPSTCINGGAVPLDRGRRPRRPACALQAADPVVPAAGRGRPARTGGSAPQLTQHSDPGKNEWHWDEAPPRYTVISDSNSPLRPWLK